MVSYYSSFSDEITITVFFNQAYATIPTVFVSPGNDDLGLSYHTAVLAGNTGFNIYIRNNTSTSKSINPLYQFDFNYIVIE